jgi:hypothetical protein
MSAMVQKQWSCSCEKLAAAACFRPFDPLASNRMPSPDALAATPPTACACLHREGTHFTASIDRCRPVGGQMKRTHQHPNERETCISVAGVAGTMVHSVWCRVC